MARLLQVLQALIVLSFLILYVSGIITLFHVLEQEQYTYTPQLRQCETRLNTVNLDLQLKQIGLQILRGTFLYKTIYQVQVYFPLAQTITYSTDTKLKISFLTIKIPNN